MDALFYRACIAKHALKYSLVWDRPHRQAHTGCQITPGVISVKYHNHNACIFVWVTFSIALSIAIACWVPFILMRNFI